MALDLGQGEFFYRAKPVKALIALAGGKREWYASALAKEVDCTFPHIVKILSKFKSFGLVSSRDAGRKKIILLSPKGRQASLMLLKSVNSLK